MSESTNVNAVVPGGRRGVKWWLAGLVVAVSATVALSAWAHRGGGDGMGHGMMMGPGMMGGAEHMGRGIDHMLDGLNASDAQRTQIKQIAQAAATDLRAQREASRGLRDKAMQLFAAPNVDAAGAESVRQQMLAQHDQASRRMLQAMLEVSKVLTPEQRAKAAERLKQRSEAMRERLQRQDRQAPAARQ